MFSFSLITLLSLFQSTLTQQSYFINYAAYYWSSDTLQCTDYTDCIVNCYSAWSCHSVTIIAPKNAKLTINCDSNFNITGGSSSGACENINIYAENSTELHINAYNAPYEFFHSTIYTPTNQSNVNTFITCGLLGPHNKNAQVTHSCGVGHNIYSINGFETVEWSYGGTAEWSLTSNNPSFPNKMHCGTDYIQLCNKFDVDGFYYRCNNTLSVCDYDRSNQPQPTTTTTTTTPTTMSSTEFTYYDYNQPTVPWYCTDFIDCTVNCLGSSACLDATIYGPTNAILTINCDSSRDIDGAAASTYGHACSDMIIYAENCSALHINVWNNNEELYNTYIYTPYNPIQPTQTNTFITCGIIGTETSKTVTSYSCGFYNQIYSINGWRTVEWSYSGNSSWSLQQQEAINMHCSQYEYNSWDIYCSLTVDGIYYRCSDSSPCDYCRNCPTTINPTTQPTIQPTMNPTDDSLFTKISSNKNYMFVGNSERNFFEAMTYCQDEYGTSLAEIYNPQQNDEVYNIVNLYSNKPAWIGASDLFSGETNWKWIQSLGPITL
eukprot:555947_1